MNKKTIFFDIIYILLMLTLVAIGIYDIVTSEIFLFNPFSSFAKIIDEAGPAALGIFFLFLPFFVVAILIYALLLFVNGAMFIIPIFSSIFIIKNVINKNYEKRRYIILLFLILSFLNLLKLIVDDKNVEWIVCLAVYASLLITTLIDYYINRETLKNNCKRPPNLTFKNVSEEELEEAEKEIENNDSNKPNEEDS